MPIYEYECSKCGEFEITQSISDEPLKKCPTCRRKVTKLISRSAFHLKGGGWYADAYEAKGSTSSAETSTEATSTTDSSDAGEAAKPAKAEPKAKEAKASGKAKPKPKST